MEIKVHVDAKPLTLPKGTRVKDLLARLGELPELMVVLVNEEPVTEDYLLKEGDRVETIRAISGG